MTRQEYFNLSATEKRALKAERKAAAIEQIKTGAFPAGIRVTVGDFTLTLKPSGVSEKGSVSYSHPATNLEIGKHTVRVNAMNLSVLAEGGVEAAEEEVEGEIL